MMDSLATHLLRADLTRLEKVLAILCMGGKSRYRIAEIREVGVANGLRAINKWNISDILGPRVKGYAIPYPDGWAITISGVQALNVKGVTQGHSPSVEVAADLRKIAAKLRDDQTRAFVEEAIGCFEAGFFRAAVVLSWMGATSVLQEVVLTKYLAQFNAEAQRQNAKWKQASTKDHFGLIEEGVFLDVIASPAVAVIGKNVKEELKNTALKLRNGCGHPNSMQIGRNKVAAHIEFLIQNVYSQFP